MMAAKKRPLVILTHALPPDWIQELEEKTHLVIGPEGGEGLTQELESVLPQAEGMLTLLMDPVKKDLLEKAPQLKVVSNMAVGVDNIDIDACTERGIPVGHTPGILTAGTADLTLALLLSVARRLPEARADAHAGEWNSWNPTGWLGTDLKGATAGIVGMGKIGTAVARRLKPFGVDLIFTNRSPKPDLEEALGAEQVPFSEIVSRSDFLCLHVPLTEETHQMVDRDVLQKMKDTAILINAARGPVVDTDTLVTALRENWIRAAGLDVTDPEPLPPEHPLYELENCLITPHIGSATHHTRRKMASIASQNLFAGLEKRELVHCVNPEVYE
jgi:phosphoglycerate dehydrogenase-like enzyme